jgi:hypothetical protein
LRVAGESSKRRSPVQSNWISVKAAPRSIPTASARAMAMKSSPRKITRRECGPPTRLSLRARATIAVSRAREPIARLTELKAPKCSVA